jgi:2,4-didehydro-3-deoxy-L-rhamnonate hydrolase
MRLVNFGPEGWFGVVTDDQLIWVDAIKHVNPLIPQTMEEFLNQTNSLHDLNEALKDPIAKEAAIPLEGIDLLAPVFRPGKIIAVAVNYRTHGAEQNREPPDHPVLFAKFPSSIIGPGGSIRWDSNLTQAVDFEAELGVVIGTTCGRVSVADALRHVAGYTCLNDVSARDLQYSDKQFVRAKSLDTFCPMGPWLVTPDEIPDPQNLAIRCLVNGNVMQDANTSDMVFGVAELISFCSHAFTLMPGDVIATGTPGGVGWFREPKQMLKDGDEVVVEIERVGRLVNRCVVTGD